jgi:hypothetical protein
MERGVKELLPACCLPRWGKEGVTPHSLFKNVKNMGSKMISTEKNLKIALKDTASSPYWPA